MKKMNYYYISGTSRGLGKAIAELLLKDEENVVFGISRGQSINHSRYRHIKIDLTDISNVGKFRFNDHPDAGTIVLINNSADLGEIKHIGERAAEKTINEYNVNIVAPTLLCNEFIKTYSSYDCKKIIINVSSGAGKHSIEGWCTYCASKAALDLMSQVIHDEQIRRYPKNPVHVFSLAPGLVDTRMQDEIRLAKHENFKRLDEFKSYWEDGMLQGPDDVAPFFVDIIDNPEEYRDVVLDVRDF